MTVISTIQVQPQQGVVVGSNVQPSQQQQMKRHMYLLPVRVASVVGLIVGGHVKLRKHHSERAVGLGIVVDFRGVIERFEERNDN